MAKPDDRNLTPLRALPLLLQVTAAHAGRDESDKYRAMRDVKEALEKHVRYGFRSKRRK